MPVMKGEILGIDLLKRHPSGKDDQGRVVGAVRPPRDFVENGEQWPRTYIRVRGDGSVL